MCLFTEQSKQDKVKLTADQFLCSGSLTRRGKHETGRRHGASDLHTVMKRAVIGQNWLFFLLWLSYNWVWSSSNGELIDLWLNSSLFGLKNNYAVIGRRRRAADLLQSFSICSNCWLLSEKVEAHEKCPPARYMKVWNCRLLFALGPSLRRYFFFYWQRGWISAWWRPPLLTPPPSSPDCFCFQVTSYLLLQLFQFLRARCMKTESSQVNAHKSEQRDDTKETETPSLSVATAAETTSSTQQSKKSPASLIQNYLSIKINCIKLMRVCWLRMEPAHMMDDEQPDEWRKQRN